MELTPRVREWRDRGVTEDVNGRRIHVFIRAGEGPLLLLLHGFPSSSFDWRLILDELTDRAVLAFDCLGFGLSEKPREHTYTLAEQADIAEVLLARHAGELTGTSSGRAPVFFVAHDMGTSVATELMARDLEGSFGGAAGGYELVGGVLFNGSMIQGAASPTLGQKLLRGPLGPLAARLSSGRFFRAQFSSIFSPGHPLSDEEARDQWALITHAGGQRIGHKTIIYMNERERFADRWYGAIGDWPKPLHLVWGMLDPVATTNVLDGVRELRPHAPLTPLEDLGHYPQIEDPARLAAAVEAAVQA